MADPRLARQGAVREALAAEDIPAFLVSHPANIRWLTGFSGSAGMVIVFPSRTVLVTDFRYAAQAPAEVGATADVIIERANIWDRARRAIAAERVSTLGFESHVVTTRDRDRVAGLVPGAIVPCADLAERFRQQKDAAEVERIRGAASLAHAALDALLPTIRPGQREIDIAARLEHELRVRGSEWHPFQTIVAAGERSALPHARSSTREVARGDLLLIDFGAQLDGYCADITRTVVVGGTASARQAEVYDLVRSAQLRARTGIRAGMSGREADALARDVIAAGGMADAFGHSLGHGLGLEVHEAPRVASTAEAILPLGAVVTVEPGIYLPGWGGVRIEDDVWLSPDGPVLLSDGRTELLELDT